MINEYKKILDDANNGEIKTLELNVNVLGIPGEFRKTAQNLVLEHEEEIRAAFPNNEFLKMHALTGEVVGFKASDEESDEPILHHMLVTRRGEEQAYCFIDLGNVEQIFGYLKKEDANVDL